jgi:hypothetical protein
MAEAASRRPLIAERSGFDLQPGPVRFVVDKVVLGQFFLAIASVFHFLSPATNVSYLFVSIQAREAWEATKNAGYVGSTGGCIAHW